MLFLIRLYYVIYNKMKCYETITLSFIRKRTDQQNDG